VSRRLASQGAIIIDFDIIAREVVAPGLPAYNAIRAAFGADVFNSDGSLNRQKLGKVVFDDPAQLRKLNALMQRPILFAFLRKFFLHALTAGTSRPIILDVPMLFESGFHYICDHTALVYTDEDVQLSRLQTRDSSDRESALKRIHAQRPLYLKRGLATTILDNNGSEGNLHSLVDTWYSLVQSHSRSWRRVVTRISLLSSFMFALFLVPGTYAVRWLLRKST